jgi:hypothetical protein
MDFSIALWFYNYFSRLGHLWHAMYESVATRLARSRGVLLEKMPILLGGTTWSNDAQRRKSGQF